MPESVTLRELHGILQVGMGWDGIHLYYFDIHAVHYGFFELDAESPDTPLSRFWFRAKDRSAENVERCPKHDSPHDSVHRFGRCSDLDRLRGRRRFRHVTPS